MPHPDQVAHYRAAGYWPNRLLTEWVESWAEKQPHKVAATDRLGRLSFAELRDEARRLAAGLHSEGIRSGDVFILQIPNWIAFSCFHVALTYLGAITVNVPTTYRHHEISTIARLTRARGIAVPDTFRRFNFPSMIDEVRHAFGKRLTAVVIGGRRRPNFHLYDDLARSSAISPDAWDHVESNKPQADDVTVISFTSGTTGEPKGVMHTSNTLGAINQVFAEACGLSEMDTILMAAPVGHSIGLMHGIRLSVVLGATLVLQDEWDPAIATRLMRREQTTFSVMAPTLLYDLVRHLASGDKPPDKLRLLLCGGSYLQESLMRSAGKALPHTTVAPLWGMTEGIGTLCSTGCSPDKLATTDGHPIPGAELKVVSESGESLGTGHEGELLLRSPTLFMGYLGRPELNERIFTEDGYLRTGDLATLEADGHLRIRGRLKELIIRGGVNISPVEIERVLSADSRIAQLAVIGAPDDRLGERIAAFVVPASGARLELQDLVAIAHAAGLAKHKWPEVLHIVGDLPTTPSGKIQRHILAAQLSQKSDS